MERFTKTSGLSQDAGATPEPHTVLRFYIDSWEVEGGAPRPAIGQPLDGYRVVFRSADHHDLYGRAALDEDVDVGALPPQVVIPPAVQGGVQRGHLQAEWHVTPSEGPLYDAEPLSGLVVRTRIISLDRRIGVGEGEEQMWLPIPGTLCLREVTGADWAFDDRALRAAPSPAALGDVVRGWEEAVLVDLQVPQSASE